MEIRDWIVIAVITAMVAVASIYLFKHPSDMNFTTWCGSITAFGGIYHWLVYLDSKKPDADHG
jgi:hypothetical protein